MAWLIQSVTSDRYITICRFNLDPQWSETGDRYMIKLFRDYVFHQVDENGAPWIDMSHIIQCLNKVGLSFTLMPCLTMTINCVP